MTRVLIFWARSSRSWVSGSYLAGTRCPMWSVTGAFGLVTLLWQQSAPSARANWRSSSRRRSGSTRRPTSASSPRSRPRRRPAARSAAPTWSSASRHGTGARCCSRIPIRWWAARRNSFAWEELTPRPVVHLRCPAHCGRLILALRREILPKTRLTPQQVLAVFVNGAGCSMTPCSSNWAKRRVNI